MSMETIEWHKASAYTYMYSFGAISDCGAQAAAFQKPRAISRDHLSQVNQREMDGETCNLAKPPTKKF